MKRLLAGLLTLVLLLGMALTASADFGEPEGTPVELDKKVSGEEYAFTLKKVSYAKRVEEKKGNVTRRYGDEGNYLIFKLKFTNKSTEALGNYSDRITDIHMVYDNQYEYEGEYRIFGNDIVPLDKGNVYIFFSVPSSMKKNTTKSQIVTFAVDDDPYTYVVCEGEQAAAESEGEAASEASLESELKVGDERTDGEKFAFAFKKLSYAKRISEKSGNVTRNYGDEGNYLVFKLKFQNLCPEALPQSRSDRITDMKLVYDGKYEYEGEYRVMAGDIVPLDKDNLYIFFSVPKELKDSSAPLVASFSIDGCPFTVDCRSQG